MRAKAHNKISRGGGVKSDRGTAATRREEPPSESRLVHIKTHTKWMKEKKTADTTLLYYEVKLVHATNISSGLSIEIPPGR